ncbi:uncharacterized protein JCM15063_002258 [Sporobolomyces koalae]|uniref:uncharacterized protein n=1 Tax=Sporobolomyces koalae TaxID=500713 RepID=UPI003173F1CD
MVAGRTTPMGRKRESTGGSIVADSSVKVVVRIRPNTGSEASNVPHRFQRIAVTPLSSTSLSADSGTPNTPASAAIASKHAPAKSTFTFDRVIGPEEGQPAVYDAASPLIESFLDGMNATVLAYGQTSSGKSYTMGTDRVGDDEQDSNPDRQGITPRAVAEIFDRMRDSELYSGGGSTYTAKVSYVEIYNEDLIDLLAGDADVRPTVQIREDKQGNIIWSGLREVKVTNAQEVMHLLSAGSSLRQTGSTDMNAQSSRSHAIFSLTLSQRRWTGLGSPPRSRSPSVTTSPTSPRVQNRLSGIPRVTSPTPGARPSTPSGRPGSRLSLRPPSQLGRPASPSPNLDDFSSNGADSWAIVTSKFHFVDLAGSERLKRTSALGDRAKEGISINAGLSSLGNVISALGDPTKKATHIPYRDSKLTRLLQDSLGGNSKTMMVACVSPTEYNIHETLSTLKYANRARNIKNRAEVNEVEVGWDDVDHLQRTILKLRAELAVIKSGDGAGMASIAEEGFRRTLEDAPTLEASELQQKVAQLTTDLARVQAGDFHESMSREQFERAVEPIVEEYERSLSALESQLSLTRAALGHSEDEMRDLEARVEEEVHANEASSLLIEELRIRIAKLSEREATTEAYVRDLEAKLKEVDDADESTGNAVTDLRKALSRNREQSESTELYIAELEARLAKSNESNQALQEQLRVLEKDIERREEAYKELEARLTLLDTSGEHKLLLAEIDEKDKKLIELERSLDEMRIKAETAAQEKDKLQEATDKMRIAQEEMDARVSAARHKASVVRRSGSLTPPHTPAETDDGEFGSLAASNQTSTSTATSDSNDLVVTLQEQMTQLKQSHTDTLAELETAKAKYADSLKEIEALSQQVQEAKLSQPSSEPEATPTSPRFSRSLQLVPDAPGDDEEADEVQELSPINSRNTSPTTSRISRSPQARRSMPLSPSHRLSFLGRGQGVLASPSHSRSASLSQELSLAAHHSSQISSPPSPRPVSPSPSSLAQRESMYGTNERSYEQIKTEVMKLQSVLKDREDEILALETTVNKLRSPIPPATPAFEGLRPDSPIETTNPTSDGDLDERAVTPPPSQPSDHDLNLSPRTRAAFDAIKADLSATGLGFSNVDSPESEETTNAQRLDDLMRSMAKKESSHREAIEELEDKLSTLQRQHDELTVLSRDQVDNMSTEISKLRTDLEGRPEASHYDNQLGSLQAELDSKRAELEHSRTAAQETLEATRQQLITEHQALHTTTLAEQAALLAQIKEEHAAVLERLTAERDAVLSEKTQGHDAALRDLNEKHNDALAQLRTSHDDILATKANEHSVALEQLQSVHEEAMRQIGPEIEQALASRLAELVASHSDALANALAEHSRQIANQAQGHQAELARLHESHAADTAAAGDRRSSVIDETTNLLSTQHAQALGDLEATHRSSLAALQAEHGRTIEAMEAERDALQRSLEDAHEAVLSEKRIAQTGAFEDAKQQRESAMEQLRAALSDKHTSATESLSKEHSDAVSILEADHQRSLEKALEEHSQALSSQEANHTAALQALVSKHEEVLQTIVTERDEVKIAHQKALSEIAKLRKSEALAQSALETLTTEHESTNATLAGLSKRNHGVVEGQKEEIALLNQRLESKAVDASPRASDNELQEALDALSTVEKALLESQQERERLMTELHELRGGDGQHKPDYDSVFKDLGQYRASVLKLDSELAKTRKERDSLSAQLARASLSSAGNSVQTGLGIFSAAPTPASFNGLGDSTPRIGSPTPDRAMSPVNEFGRNSPRPDSRFLPPAVPPPSMPPPAAPVPNSPLPPVPSGMPLSRAARSSSSSSNGHGRNSISNDASMRPLTDSQSIDPRVAKRFEEQEAQIARLLKQLSHCEGELDQTQAKLNVNASEIARLESEHQANADLINTLESALNDSERNLRKTRMNANEIVRERDQYKSENERLRIEAQDSHTTSESYRQSVLDMEERLQDQRNREARAERARQELELRMQAASKKRSKYNCL